MKRVPSINKETRVYVLTHACTQVWGFFYSQTVCVEKEKSLGGTCLNVGCIPSKVG